MSTVQSCRDHNILVVREGVDSNKLSKMQQEITEKWGAGSDDSAATARPIQHSTENKPGSRNYAIGT